VASSGKLGWRRIVVVTIIGTAAVIAADRAGIIPKLVRYIGG